MGSSMGGKLQAEQDRYRERAVAAEARAQERTNEVIDLEGKLHGAERQTLALQLPAGPPEKVAA